MQTLTKQPIKTTSTLTKNQIPIQLSAVLPWKKIFKLLENFQHKIILNITPIETKKEFTPEQETMLLENTGIYTNEFIKKNEKLKKNIKNTMTCNSIDELIKNLSS